MTPSAASGVTRADGEPTEAERTLASDAVWQAVSDSGGKGITGAVADAVAQLLTDQRAEIHARYAPQIHAADHLSFTVTSYMLGDLDGGVVAKAQQAYRDTKNEEVPF